jgi:hypothetical protein
MQKRSSTPTRDVNEMAFQVINAAVSKESIIPALGGKNPAAVALGRLGGLKGGPARKRKLSAKRRSAIAAKAARARWKKTN